MKKIIALFFAAVLMSGHASSENHPAIDEIRDFLDGESELWPTFEQCATEFASCAFAAGQVSMDNNEFGNAERFFLQALELGNQQAVSALVLLNFERREPIETFAWSQLGLIQKVEGDQSRLSDHKNSWVSRQLHEATEQLSEQELERGYALAEQRIAQWLPMLLEDPNASDEPRTCPFSMPAHRKAPRYPRAMAVYRQPGWSYAIVEVSPEGDVINQVSVLSTHHLFAKTTVKALKKWRFEPLPEDSDCETRRFSQVMDYVMTSR